MAPAAQLSRESKWCLAHGLPPSWPEWEFLGLSSADNSGRGRGSAVLPQVAAKMRDGEGDGASLGGVDQALLHERIARRRKRRRLTAEVVGDGSGRNRTVGLARQPGHRA